MRLQISYDIVQDIVVQGDHMRDTLQQLQDAVYLTKVFLYICDAFIPYSKLEKYKLSLCSTDNILSNYLRFLILKCCRQT